MRTGLAYHSRSAKCRCENAGSSLVADRLNQFVQQPLQPFILIRPFNPQHLDFYGNRPVGRIEQRKGAWAAAQRASLRGNIAKGARSLGELAERLWSRLRFRRFKIERHGKHIQLWGYINPWVLLADGTVDWREVEGSYEVGDIKKLAGRGGSVEKVPFKASVEDFYLTNPIARASAVMAECSRLASGQMLTAAE